MQLALSTSSQVKQYLERSRTLVLPMGSTEQHGPIGLIGTDTLCAQSIAQALGATVANSQSMALGVIQAVASSGKDILTVGVDGIQQMLDDVKGGTAHATVAQYPYVMGRMGVEACIVAVQGGTVTAQVDSPIVLVTADNVDEVLASSPKPPGSYDDPYAALISK